MQSVLLELGKDGKEEQIFLLYSKEDYLALERTEAK